MYFELSNLENKCTLDYSIWNGETITLNHEFEGGRGYSDDAEVCGKILVAATQAGKRPRGRAGWCNRIQEAN